MDGEYASRTATPSRLRLRFWGNMPDPAKGLMQNQAPVPIEFMKVSKRTLSVVPMMDLTKAVGSTE
jgi:hypothetical protein